MPRPPKPVPNYRLHKQSGQAIVTVRTPDGDRQDILLGPYNSPESLAEYQRVIAQIKVGGPADRSPMKPADITVNEVLAAFLRHAAGHYRDPDGVPTEEVVNFKRALKPVRELYGHTPAAEFGPLALKAVRQRMVDLGWCRTQVNNKVGRVKRVWKWAASEELIPAAAHQALTTVAGLQPGRSAAKERPPVGPVDPAHVEKSLPFLSRHCRGLILFMRFTGCRPGEACRLTRGQIDTSSDPWVYRPVRHKTRHKGKARAIPLGPKARALLAEFPTAGPDDPVFSPRAAREERYAAMRAARKSKVQPSQVYRRKAKPVRAPGRVYTADAVGFAVAKACDKAFPPPPPVGRRPGESVRAWRARLTDADRAALARWRAEHGWHPNQLRHTFATEVRKGYGLEAAQVLLGHSRADVTQVYAERDAGLAAEVARKVG